MDFLRETFGPPVAVSFGATMTLVAAVLLW
jgi:hypothetical protein